MPMKIPAGFQTQDNISWGVRSTHPGLLEIIINNPKMKNAIGSPPEKKMVELINGAQDNKDIKVILLHGGRFFSSGNDLSALVGFTGGDIEKAAHEGVNVIMVNMLMAINQSRKPIVAVVRGFAIGIGYTLLSHCTFVYCSPETRFISPFMASCQSPEGASTLLFPELMGTRLGMEVLLTDRTLSAKEAMSCGFVNGIIDTFDPKSDEVDPDQVPVIKKLLATDYRTLVNGMD